MKLKIVCLSSFLNHARHRKRINAFYDLGASVKILAFERVFYPAKALRNKHISLGKIQHGNYFSRLKHILSAVLKVRSEIKESDILYVFDFDMMLLGLLASFGLRTKIICEVGDVHNILLAKGLVPAVLRIIEKIIIRKIDLLVVTSEAYVNGYYKGILGITRLNYFVLENKVDSNQMGRVTKEPAIKNDSIVIGYFGGLQCADSWKVLKHVVKESKGKILLYVRGLSYAFQSDLEKDAASINGIEYGGPYVNPDELPEIYNKVDVVWAAHHHGKANILWARANRFYESCYFRKPMIAQLDTEDGRIVDGLNIGVCIDLEKISESVEKILNIAHADFSKWHDNLSLLPEKVYTYSNEYRKLFKEVGIKIMDKGSI